MTAYTSALAAEWIKARRAPVLWIAAGALQVLPAFTALFLYALPDPENARRLGLIGQKAQLAGGAADWPTLLQILGQGIAVAGAILFGLVTAWVFGREHADRTLRIWLACPVPRGAVLAAKGTVVVAWCAAMAAAAIAAGIAVGAGSSLPSVAPHVVQDGIARMAAAAAFTIAVLPVTAFVAMAGRGYLPAVGFTVAALALANIAAVLGWGGAFPWAVPALVSGAGGPEMGPLSAGSYLLVAATGAAGAAAAWRYAERADHSG